MKLKENPFHILGATPLDNKQRLVDLCDEMSIFGNAMLCEEALAVLVNPRKRISAEMRYYSRFQPRRVSDNDQLSLFDELCGYKIFELDMLLKAIYDFTENPYPIFDDDLYSNAVESIAQDIIFISEIFDKLLPYAISVKINEDRIIAGFPQVENLQFVEDELKSIRAEIRNTIIAQLANLEIKEMAEIVIAILDECGGAGYVIVDDIVDYYQVQTYSELNQKSGKIMRWIDAIKKHAERKEFSDDAAITLLNTKIFNELPFPKKIEAFCQLIKAWDNIAQPLQLNAQNKGLKDSESEAIAYAVRDLAILLFNEHGLLEFSKRIITVSKELFGELDSFAEKVDEDIAALHKIQKEQAEIEKREKQAIEQFELSKRKNRENTIYSVTILGGEIRIPKFCTCCMAETEKTENVNGSGSETHGNTKRTRTVSLDFALCDGCLQHRMKTRNKKWIANYISILLGIATTFFAWNHGKLEAMWLMPFVATLTSYLILGLIIKTPILADEHSSKEWSVWFSGVGVSINTVTINFTNWFYAKLFSEANGRNLAEASRRNRVTKRNVLQSISHPIANCVLVCCIVGASLIAMSIFEDGGTPSNESYGGNIGSNAYSAKQQNDSTTTFNQSKLDYPTNGYSQNFTSKEREAPLEIKTPSGSNYYYIILKDSVTGRTATSLFVHPGRTAEIEVPLGNYRMYYAAGEIWYGTTLLFGPNTIYSKADDVFDFHISGNSVMGYTVELIKQTGGNLSTSGASANDFAQ